MGLIDKRDIWNLNFVLWMFFLIQKHKFYIQIYFLFDKSEIVICNFLISGFSRQRRLPKVEISNLRTEQTSQIHILTTNNCIIIKPTEFASLLTNCSVNILFLRFVSGLMFNPVCVWVVVEWTFSWEFLRIKCFLKIQVCVKNSKKILCVLVAVEWKVFLRVIKNPSTCF